MTEDKEKTKSITNISRRSFIKGAAAGATLVAGGALLSSSIRPSNAQASFLPSWDYTADVVVVGNGFAGTCAAIGAYDGGASVLILEKAPQGMDGGNSGASGGGVKLITPLTDFITVVSMACYGVTPLDVVTTFCTETTNIPNWIKSLGGSMVITPAGTTTGIPPTQYAGFVSPDLSVSSATIAIPSFPYPTKTGATGSSGHGADFFAFLDNCRASRKIPIMYQTPAKQLIQHPFTGEVIGVTATDLVNNQVINVKANKGVILACGGWENNPEMQVNSGDEVPKTEVYAFAGTPYNTGDGVIMAQKVGAKLWHMNKKDIPFLSSKAAQVEIGDGIRIAGIGKGCPSATTLPVIYVNRNGKRFMNEYFTSGHQDTTMEYDTFWEKFKVPDGVDFCDWPNIPFYAIFDSVAMKAGPLDSDISTKSGYHYIHKLYTWSSDNSAEVAKGWIVTADTPKDLGAKIICKDFFGNVVGMDAAGLDATVTAYNAMCAAGTDTDFGRATSTLRPLSNPPFYAMELCECMVNTDGGPAHDKYARTLDLDNNPIPRLYTPGELGSLWGGLYYGSGNVPEAIAMGRVAGAHAANLPDWGEAVVYTTSTTTSTTATSTSTT